MNRFLMIAILAVACFMCMHVTSAFVPKPSFSIKEGTTCCLPPVHTYTATFYQKKYAVPTPPVPPTPPTPVCSTCNGTNTNTTNNSTISTTVSAPPKEESQPDSIIVHYSLDLVNFRRRELTIVQSNNTKLVYSTIRIKNQDDSYTYEYRIKPEKCTCSKYKNVSWKNTCVTAGPNAISYSIGKSIGFITMNDSYGGKSQYTTLIEPMASEICWLTSKTMFLTDSVQDYKYYNMMTKVDKDDFKIPSNCPAMEECWN